MIELRDYQEKCVGIAVNYFNETRPIPSVMVLPTAAGKSIIISSIAHRLKGKTVVIQPSVELLKQNYGKLISLGGEASIYSASAGEKEIGDITYVTIGSVKSIGHLFREKGVRNVIVDECHLFPPNISSMFGGFIKDLGVKSVLGLTATPFRLQTYTSFSGFPFSQLNIITSRKKGGGFFKEILYTMQISEIVSMGYWAKLKYELIDFDPSELMLNSTGSDYTDKSLVRSLAANHILDNVADYVKKSKRKRILIFVPLVHEAHNLSSMIPNSAVVWGEMDKEERVKTLQKFNSGKIRVVINVNVLSVGYDNPEIDCIIIARPTASLAWYYQAAGRGTRISKSKEDCLIVDFVGTIDKFGILENLQMRYHNGKYHVLSNDRQLTEVPISGHGILSELKPVTTSEQDKDNPKLSNLKNGTANSQDKWPYGKHKDVLISELPKSYVMWVLENFNFNSSNKYLIKKLEKRLEQILDSQN